MWYVVPHKIHLSLFLADNPRAFLNFNDAREKAEFLREETGNHYHVIKLQTVWTTKTLHEAMAEG